MLTPPTSPGRCWGLLFAQVFSSGSLFCLVWRNSKQVDFGAVSEVILQLRVWLPGPTASAALSLLTLNTAGSVPVPAAHC